MLSTTNTLFLSLECMSVDNRFDHNKYFFDQFVFYITTNKATVSKQIVQNMKIGSYPVSVSLKISG